MTIWGKKKINKVELFSHNISAEVMEIMEKPINEKYINLLVEMLRNHETKNDLCKVLRLSRSSIDKRFSGEVEWTIGDVENLCKHYEKDYYYLFSRTIS